MKLGTTVAVLWVFGYVVFLLARQDWWGLLWMGMVTIGLAIWFGIVEVLNRYELDGWSIRRRREPMTVYAAGQPIRVFWDKDTGRWINPNGKDDDDD